MQKVLDLSYRALMLQDKTGPLANVYNRLAMACALNRQAVLDELRARPGPRRRPRAARPVRDEAGLGGLPDAEHHAGEVVPVEGR